MKCLRFWTPLKLRVDCSSPTHYIKGISERNYSSLSVQQTNQQEPFKMKLVSYLTVLLHLDSVILSLTSHFPSHPVIKSRPAPSILVTIRFGSGNGSVESSWSFSRDAAMKVDGHWIVLMQLILAVVLSAAWAAPSSQQLESVQPVAIVSSRSEINQDGSYSYA